tara:strand:+ start:3327 stop:3572 length:246 start_codon:yes stop_codon:yes gene_type:complete
VRDTNMTNKKTNNTQKSDFNAFQFTMGLAGIAGVVFFPVTAAGLVLLSLFGEDSARGDFWESVGPVRAENYANPLERPYHR